MTWRTSSSCLGSDPDDFFPYIWPEEKLDSIRLVEVRERDCRDCPVRRACLAEVMEIERGEDAATRFGLYAYLTPGQRESIEKRGIATCPRCGTTRDPVLLARGDLVCPIRCGQPDRHVEPPPYDGDQWTKRHTTLSKRIVAWIIDNAEPGDGLPTPAHMADLMGGIRKSDVLRVYAALIEDRTVKRSGPKQSPTYHRGAKVALHNWTPNWTD